METVEGCRERKLVSCTCWMGVFGPVELLPGIVLAIQERNRVNGEQGGRNDAHGIGIGGIRGPKVIL